MTSGVRWRRIADLMTDMDPVQDLVHSFAACYDDSPSALAPHPHRSLYKNNSRTKSDLQNERRRERLAQQKEKREALLSSRRDSDDVSASDISEVMDVWDADDVMDCSRPARRKRRGRAYRDILMLSEWMIEVPERFAEDWLLIVCPVGKRCAVVSSQGQTRCFARNGFEFLTKFPSLLPGGNGNSRGAAKHNAILDCIFSESEKTFFVLDVILWNGVSFYGCQTDFRFFWLDSKNSDILPASQTSDLNKFAFKLLPHFPCTKSQIRDTLAEVSCPSGVDGYLFVHKECGYVAGVTPLVSWLKKEMVHEMLLGQNAIVNKDSE